MEAQRSALRERASVRVNPRPNSPCPCSQEIALVNRVVSAGLARYRKPKWPVLFSLANRVVPRSNPSSLLWMKGFLFNFNQKEARMKTTTPQLIYPKARPLLASLLCSAPGAQNA